MVGPEELLGYDAVGVPGYIEGIARNAGGGGRNTAVRARVRVNAIARIVVYL